MGEYADDTRERDLENELNDDNNDNDDSYEGADY